jgi:hypothetical protein
VPDVHVKVTFGGDDIVCGFAPEAALGQQQHGVRRCPPAVEVRSPKSECRSLRAAPFGCRASDFGVRFSNSAFRSRSVNAWLADIGPPGESGPLDSSEQQRTA